MKRYALLMALAVMLCGTEARAANIGFDENNVTPATFDPLATSIDPLGLGGDTFSGQYVEDGFTVSKFGGLWHVTGAVGSPVQDIFSGPIDPGSQATISVNTVGGDSTGTGELFTFEGIDLSISYKPGTVFDMLDPAVFRMTGLNDELGVFSVTFAFDDASTFKRLSISDLGILGATDFLTITALPGANINTFKIDNICVKEDGDLSACLGGDPNGGPSVPEPASLLLLGAGLAGIGIWRGKAAR